MGQYKWAKLWCDAFEGDSFRECLTKGDTFNPLLFLYVVAKCKSMGDGNGKVSISTKRIAHTFGTNYRKLARNLLETWPKVYPSVSVEVSEEFCQFVFPNWLKFQGSGKKRKEEFSENVPTEERREKKEERSKKKEYITTVAKNIAPVPASPKELMTLFGEQEIQELVAIYCEDFVDREASKCWLWLTNNSSKAPRTKRGFKKCFTNWLSRGWDSYRKQLPTQQVSNGI